MEAAPNKRSYIRMNAIPSLLMEIPRETVCKQFCRSDRMIRLWIEMFNRGGIDALITRPKPGRPRKVKLERIKDLLLPVLENPSKAGEVHWTGVKVHGYLKEQLSMDLGYRTTIRWLHELNFHLRVPQSWPERKGPWPPTKSVPWNRVRLGSQQDYGIAGNREARGVCFLGETD